MEHARDVQGVDDIMARMVSDTSQFVSKFCANSARVTRVEYSKTVVVRYVLPKHTFVHRVDTQGRIAFC